MHKLLARPPSILLLAGLWATAAGAQTATVQPVTGAEWKRVLKLASAKA